MKVENLRGKVALLLVFVAGCTTIFLYLFSQAGGNLRLSAPYTFTATVPDAFQLVPQSDVRRAGVKIGRVTDVDSAGGSAQVTIEIKDGEQAPVYNDARILVRTKTLVGENYLDLDPGTPAAGELADRGKLPVGNGDDAVQLDQILSALDDETRAAVRRNLRTAGSGLGAAEGKDLNRLFGAARPTVASGARLMGLLNRQRDEVAALVADTGTVLNAFARRSADVRSLAGAAKTTAVAVAARDAELKATLGALPSTLDQARSTTTRLGAFSGRATPVLRDLRFAVSDLTPVVRDLRPTASTTRALVREVPAALREVDPLLSGLETFTTAAEPAVPRLDRLLDEAIPALAYLAPYSREAGSFFANVGSMNGVRDAFGQIGRVHLQVGLNTLGVLTPEARSALDLLLKSDLVAPLFSEGQNSYPLPGTIGSPGLEQNYQKLTRRPR